MNPFQNPTIYIGSLRIDEPITTLTDFIFFGMCTYAFIKTKSVSNYKAMNLYRWFFLTTGTAAVIGAVFGHAFLYYVGFEAKLYGWGAAIISVVFAQFAALYHIKPLIKQTTFKLLFFINTTETILALIAVYVYVSFKVVEIHSAFGLLLIVTVLEYKNYKNNCSITSKYLICGIVTCVLAVLCHVLKIKASVWFNHMDLSHVIMTVSIYIMYKGVLNFKPTTTS